MAVIACMQTDRRVVLTTHHQVGRAPSADLQIDGSAVSGLHALFAWDGEAWTLRDLGSSNGTAVGESRVGAGEDRELTPGDIVYFGSRTEGWRIVNLAPPEPMLVCGERVRLLRDSVGLPDDRRARVYVLRDSSGVYWVVEGRERWPLAHRSTIRVGIDTWRAYLDAPVKSTFKEQGDGPTTVSFRVSRGEEHVEVDVVRDGRSDTLKSRAHTYLLLTLARLRLQDRESGVPESECGWTHTDVLCDLLRIDRSVVYTQVFRARKQLEKAELGGVAEYIVEHRRSTSQLRFGVRDVKVDVL